MSSDESDVEDDVGVVAVPVLVSWTTSGAQLLSAGTTDVDSAETGRWIRVRKDGGEDLVEGSGEFHTCSSVRDASEIAEGVFKIGELDEGAVLVCGFLLEEES